MAKRKAVVDKTHCVACGCCTTACKLHAITVFHGIYAQVSDRCVGCAKCAAMCPADAISMEAAT